VKGRWSTVAEGTTVGYKRILPIDPVMTDRVRVSVLDSRATPFIAEVGLYSTERHRSE
jgi:alpha-L-fucosidase